MEKIIIVYSTTDNYTIKICNKIKDVIEQKSNSVTLLSIDSEKINLIKSLLAQVLDMVNIIKKYMNL
ncbi:hypothetical protein [Malaciobacter marinus]|jgi:flavodoxin|uniref:hypothetical protein n=1 Tax=Malaciobacter marinus TaxID=505249 RepID=UPI0009C6EA18|nr:hypothetical protein [Malaciobacter marinus]SKB59583.1 hypothetical protein SAMN06295997_12238 [Malaciobacter marinus]